MFGWRKKKPEEEELVPRGMIWYGTTESSSDEPQRAEPPAQPIESEQPAVHTAEVIEMRRPPASERPVDELRPAVNGAFPVSPVARAVASTPLAFQPRR